MNHDQDLAQDMFDAISRDEGARVANLAAYGAPFKALGPDKESAGMLAARLGSWKAITAITRAGADSFAESHAHSWSLKPGIDGTHAMTLWRPAGSTPSGRTALIEAVRLGHRLAAQTLAELGADLEARSAMGVRAIDAAVQADDFDMVLMLARAGSDLWADSGMFCHGRSALQQAAWGGRSMAVQALVQAGADPAARDASGATAKDIAHARGFDAIASLLRKSGAPSGPRGSRRARWRQSIFQALAGSS